MVEGKRLEISSRKLVIPRNISGKDGQIKDKNGMELTEAEYIKRWQEYTEELYRKDLHDPNYTMVFFGKDPDYSQISGNTKSTGS